MNVVEEEFESLWARARGNDREAQLAMGRHYQGQSDYGRARRWFSRAARQGQSEASVELGRQMLAGLGIAASIHDAIGHFQHAASGGSGAGHFELANIYYRGRDIPRDAEAAADHLIQAVHAGHSPALRIYAFLAAERGDQPLATQCFLLAAEGEDRLAQNALAQRLASGLGISQNLSQAAHWSRQAKTHGSYCQQHLHRLDKLPGQAGPVPGMSPTDLETPVFARPTISASESPAAGKSLRLFARIYTHEECEYLIETAAPYLLPSHTIHPDTGKAVHNRFRTSHSWSFHPTQEDIVIMRMKERLAMQTGLGVEHAEPFAMLRYREGQEYQAHFDFIDPASGEAGREITRTGQRQQTIFSYLNDVAEGGETEFPRMNLKIPPREGNAVLFHNVLATGAPDPESLHASLPVRSGEKWLATLWFRDRPLYGERTKPQGA